VDTPGSPGPENEACKLCNRWALCRNPFTRVAFDRADDGPVDLLIVGQKPGFYDDDRTGRMFSDESSQKLMEHERTAGLHQFRIARQYAVRCAQPGDAKPTPEQVKLCAPFLRADIERHNPKVVVPLGNEALQAATGDSGIMKHHGHQKVIGGRIYLPAYHPNYVARDPRFLRDLIQDLTQAREILATKGGAAPIWERLKSRYRIVTTHEEAARWIAFLAAQPLLSYDSEYAPNDFLADDYRVLMVQFSWGPGTGVAFPVDHPESPFLGDASIKAALVWLLERSKLIVQNAVVDIRAAVALGADFWKLDVVWETMLASIRVDGKEASHALKQLAYSYADTGGYEDELEEFKRRSLEVRDILKRALKRPGSKHRPPDDVIAEAQRFWDSHASIYDGVTYATIPLKILANPYGCGDTDTTFQLYLKQIPPMKERGEWWYYTEIFRHAWRGNYVMQAHGIGVDWDEWRHRNTYWAGEKRKIYDSILADPQVREYAEAVEGRGKDFTLGSDQQMAELLFEVLGLEPTGRKTPTGRPQMDENAMKEIAANPKNAKHPIMQALMLHSDVTKALGTYSDGYAEKMYADGRVHAGFHNFVNGGRRGSKVPNVQNIPAAPGKVGIKMRGGIVGWMKDGAFELTHTLPGAGTELGALLAGFLVTEIGRALEHAYGGKDGTTDH
jgi:uracil-DNA glycosylase family 4